MPRVARSSAVLGALAAGLASWGIAVAAPAQAIDDPTRPEARVTHGPSCRPGGVAVEVTAGTVAYEVVLASTRRPAGEDQARLDPGQTVELRTGDVDWGETIDTRLLFTALDDSGTAYVDELSGFEFTRPAQEDCAAIAPPTAEATVPPMSGSAGTDDLPADGGPVPAGDLPGPTAALTAASGPASVVAAGDVVTLTASGFAAGETVAVLLEDGTQIATSVADVTGLVAADVRIPAAAPTGATTLVVVGGVTSTTVAVDLRIAAAESPAGAGDGAVWPLVLAGAALSVAAGGLGVAALRGRAARRPSGSA
ncbi:hypothetical protein [Blastococcus sp. SYSU D00695]